MLTLQDCIATCGLTKEEIEALAMHEHVPEVIATEIANYLVHTPDGLPVVRRAIVDDLSEARRRGDRAQVRRLQAALRHFIREHPHCRCASEEELAYVLHNVRGAPSG